MELEDIKKLADLSRLDIDEKEMIEIIHDFDSILTYVSQVQEAVKLSSKALTKGENIDLQSKLKNVMRKDIPTSNPGRYADEIIKEMPESEGRFLKVKRIL